MAGVACERSHDRTSKRGWVITAEEVAAVLMEVSRARVRPIREGAVLFHPSDPCLCIAWAWPNHLFGTTLLVGQVCIRHHQRRSVRITLLRIRMRRSGRGRSRAKISAGQQYRAILERKSHDLSREPRTKRGDQVKNGNATLRSDWRNHVFAQRSANWQRNWDRRSDHFWHGHRCHFVNGSWVIFDLGFYPWDTFWYPYGNYYGYGYYP